MGTTYFVANTTKRQYFDPGSINDVENPKRSGILWGLSGHALALLLLPDCRQDFYLESWIGDGLVLVGDESEPNRIEQLRPFQQDAEQDAYHIVTEQFDNISLNLIAQLCKRDELLDHFFACAERENCTFVNLAHIVMHLSVPHIESKFIARFGPNWRGRYIDTLKSESWHYPLPMTPESRKLPRPNIVRAEDVIRNADG